MRESAQRGNPAGRRAANNAAERFLMEARWVRFPVVPNDYHMNEVLIS